MSFRFHSLTPAQVESAAFVPQMSAGVYVPKPAPSHDLMEHRTASAERAIASLQDKVDKQEHLIKKLEEQIAQNNLKDDRESIVNGVMNVIGSSITQLNSLRDAENAKLRQKVNRMARENRALVSNLQLTLRRRDLGVIPSRTQASSQSVDCLLLEDSDEDTKPSFSLTDTNNVETCLFSSDLMDFEFPSTSSGDSDGIEQSASVHDDDVKKDELIGILLEGIDSTTNDQEPHGKASASLKLNNLDHVSDPQPVTPTNLVKSTSHVSRPSRRHGSSASSISARKVAPAPVPWDGRIRWKTTRGFSTSAEELAALRMGYGTSGSVGADLGLFQHGLVFLPDDDEDNIYRAVTITGIPRQVNMATVLKPVCGGPLYSVQLLRTAHLTGSHTAIVTFLYEEDARDFIQSTSVKDVMYSGNRAKVSLVRSPTFPIPKNLKRFIFQAGHTRCLSISEVPQSHTVGDLLNSLLAWNNVFGNLLESIQEFDGGATFHVRFHSIRAAGQAFFALKKHNDYRDCVIKFVPDPCDRPAI